MDTLLDRFIRYVQIDTQSSDTSGTAPSTAGQWDLLQPLKEELQSLGAADIELTEHGHLLAGIPPAPGCGDAPVVALVAHVDTALELPGKDVRPRIHEKYDGSPIRYPEEPNLVLDPKDFPNLLEKVGHTIITASGKTLLGADDKAGVAIVMTLAARLLGGGGHSHGPVRLCFTPDEEIGKGVVNLDLAALAADVAYTIDGDDPGMIQYETFSADRADIVIEGVSIHPGRAKGRMVNALRLATELIASLPLEGCAPETTEGREGFIHPVHISGNQARVALHLILRDFELQGLREKGELLQKLCSEIEKKHPPARVECRISKQYRNMRYWLESDMRPVELAREAFQSLGLAPKSKPVRGGTDGSALTERGLPTPNFFCGAQNAHGPLEWVSLEDMELAVQALMKLLALWSREKASS